MYLLDTNAVSELRKVPNGKADDNFSRWSNKIDIELFFINHVILLELKKWILLTERKDQQQAEALRKWLNIFLFNFQDRVLPITETEFLRCAELHVPNPRPQFDSLIAATALVHNLTLVTRNTKDFRGIEGLSIINPFGD